MSRPSLAATLLGACLALAAARPAAAFTPAEARSPMTVTLVRSDAPDCGADCPEWLALTGRIGFDTTPRLAAALARLGHRRVPVLLDSPGGESLAGLAMGRMLRARGFDTAVATTTLTPCDPADRACQGRLRAGLHPGHVGPAPGSAFAAVCASACVFALAGGVDRAVPRGAFVGVHQAKRVLTYHPVVNMFRVLSRVVNGRKVEISRTLVSTRALPVRVVTGAAPQSIYSEFDRFLLGMGVDESIMPLMRATPPTGIHWMTASELASTRIANDSLDVAALVARSAPAPAAPSPPTVSGRSRAVLVVPSADGAASGLEGGVAWALEEPPASAPRGTPPSLDGTVDVPGLRATVTVTSGVGPTDPALIFRLRFDPSSPSGTGGGPPGQPAFRDRFDGPDGPILGATMTRTGDVATIAVARNSNGIAEDALRGRPWLAVPLILGGGKLATLVLNLNGAGRPAIDAWLARAFAAPPPAPVTPGRAAPRA